MKPRTFTKAVFEPKADFMKPHVIDVLVQSCKIYKCVVQSVHLLDFELGTTP